MNAKIEYYVLVVVTYDYYRFQRNLAISTNNSDFEHVIKQFGNEYERRSKKQKFFDDKEQQHLWIERFSNEKTN